MCLAAIVSSLASCTTYYKNPPEDPSRYGLIKNSFDTSGANIFKYEYYMVEQVDGLPVDYNWIGPAKARIRVTPGSHRLLIKAAQSGGFQSVPYRVTKELTISAQAGKTYVPGGKVEGASVQVWVEDESSGKVVSEKTWLSFEPALQANPPPVFIPPVMLR